MEKKPVHLCDAARKAIAGTGPGVTRTVLKSQGVFDYVRYVCPCGVELKTGWVRRVGWLSGDRPN